MPDPDVQAATAFAEYLALKQRDAAPDFEAFCRDRPEISQRLRALHDSWQGHAPGTESPARPAGEGGPAPDTESGLKDRLRRLAARIPLAARYKLQDEVARGGMGVIYRAWDNDLRRTLAMKVGPHGMEPKDLTDTPLVDLQNLGRFLDEAQITGQLEHPGIVPVHELGLDDKGRVFFTMRLVKGITLDEVFRLARAEKDGWTRPRALNLVLRVCEAMAYAHSKGVIHRDLKPANVMVGKFGETYVMDWGLAKVLGRPDRHDLRLHNAGASMTHIRTDRVDAAITGDSPLLTMEGTVFGTPAYMPPEQALGRVEELEPRSDIYSVGAMLYQLLTGRMPYADPDGKTNAMAVLEKLISGPPVSVPELDPSVPPELIAICDKAMARQIAGRYGSMLEMAEDLRAYLEGRVVRAYETGAWAEFRKWVVRNRLTAASLAALLLVAIGGVAIFAWQRDRQVRDLEVAQKQIVSARDDARTNEQAAVANAARAKVNEERAAWQSYVANLVAADASLRVSEASEAKRRLGECPEGFRGWAWRHLMLRTDMSRRILVAHEGKVTALAASPDGTRLVTAGDDRAARVWDLASGEAVFGLAGLGDTITHLAFSPDGDRIAGACVDRLVRLWDARTGGPLAALPGHEGAVTCVAFRADGALLASGSTDETVRLWSVADARPGLVLEGLDRPVKAVAFSPDGGRVAVALEDTVEMRDTATGAVTGILEGHGGVVTCLAFAPDGRIATGCFDRVVRVFDAAGGLRAVMRGHGDFVYDAVFDGRGATLATASFDKTVRLWDAASGEPLAVFLGHDEPVRAVAFLPDGRLVSGAEDGTLRVWERGGEAAVRVVSSDEALFTAAAFAPDGASVLAGELTGALRLLDPATGAARRTLDVPGGVRAAAFGPDGLRIVTGGEEDSAARIFDAATGRQIEELQGHEASITAVAFGPKGARIATGSADATVRLWDAATGDERARLEGHDQRVTAVAFHPAGDLLASAGFDGTIRLWDAGTGAPRRTLEGHAGAVTALAFSADGALLASAGADQRMRLWDTATWEQVRTLAGHEAGVTSLAFGPDRHLASGGQDKKVRLWDTASGDLLLTLLGHDNWVTAVAFSADGSRLASASFDGTLRIWNSAR